PCADAVVNGTIVVRAEGSFGVGQVTVTFGVIANQTVIASGTDSTPPYSFNWDTSATGNGPVTIVASTIFNSLPLSDTISVVVDSAAPANPIQPVTSSTPNPPPLVFKAPVQNGAPINMIGGDLMKFTIAVDNPRNREISYTCSLANNL